MKEQLTNQPQNVHTTGGEIFMDQRHSEQPESIANENEASITSTSSEVVAFSPFTKSPDQIQNPQLRDYARSFARKIEEKPLSSWAVEELKSEYFKLHSLSSKLEDRTRDFGEKERIASEAQPYNQLIMQELENRGEDLRELFLESTRKAGEAGDQTRSIGAASIDRFAYSDTRLQNIIGEINAEIGRVGEGNPLEQGFIRDQVQRVRNLLDQQLLIPEEANRLLTDLRSFMAEAGAAAEGERRARTRENEDINRVVGEIEAATPESPERREKIMELLRYFSPHERTIPREVILYALEFDETLDSVVNRIVSAPLDAETSRYQLSFQGGINLEQIKDILKQESERTDLSPAYKRKKEEQYSRVIISHESLGFLHDMNTHIITGNLDQFISISQGITPEHFMHFRNTLGVSEVMRLYEEKYQELLSRYGRISSPMFQQLNEEVRRGFYSFNENSLLGGRRLEEWEMRRALNVGRKFFNITFRSSELVATGKVPRDIEKEELPQTLEELEAIFRDPTSAAKFREGDIGGKERFSSFPLETATRLMNWYMYMSYRFIIAEPRGGMKFLSMVGDRYFEFLKDKGIKLDKNKIIQLGGVNVREMELGGMFGVTGVYSSWRIENQALPSIKVVVDGESISIREWLTKHREDFLRERLKFKKASETKNKAGELAAQVELSNILAPLIDSIGVGLGILLKQEVFEGKLGYEARKKLWEKIVLGNDRESEDPHQGNLSLIVNYLTNLKTSDNSILSISEIKARDGTDGARYWDVPSEDPDSPGETLPSRWEKLREKILLQHELNIKRGAGVEMTGIADQNFDADETRLIKSIKTEGLKLVPDLADIAFPYMPFMNDAPFELFDYNVSGAEFYKRRTGGDLPSFYKAGNAFVSIMNNPGGIGAEKGMEQFYGIVDGIQSPNGTEDAQNKVFPMFETWIDWIMTKPLQRQAFWKAFQHFRREPTSSAQQYSGMSADSLDEHQTLDLLEKSVQIGILNPDLLEEMKKKKNLKFGGIIFALFRDLFLVGIVGGTMDFGKSTTKGLDQR